MSLTREDAFVIRNVESLQGQQIARIGDILATAVRCNQVEATNQHRIVPFRAVDIKLVRAPRQQWYICPGDIP